MAKKCSFKNPCRPVGIGPSCWARVSVPKDSRDGSGSDSTSPSRLASNGESVTTLPDNVAGGFNAPCCDDCGDTGETGDGGTTPTTTTAPSLGMFDPLQDGFTTEDLEPDPGAESTNECIAKLRKKLAQDLQNCMCNCFNDADGTGYETDSGGGPYCWGKCMQMLEADFSLCYCREVICGGKQDVETEPNATKTPSPRYEEASYGPSISEINLSLSSYDRVIPLVYNRGIVEANVIWVGDTRVTNKCVGDVSEDPDTGQLIVRSTRIQQTFVDLALGLCEGEIAGVSRIWIDDKLIFNNTLDTDDNGIVDPTSTVTVVENIGVYNRSVEEVDKFDRTLLELRTYPGSEDQTPDPTLDHGIAYRGLAYIVFKNFELTSFNGDVPEIRVEVVKAAELAEPRITSELPTDGALDGNAGDFLYVDRVSRRIYIGSDTTNPGLNSNGVRALDYDTLEVVDEITGEPGEDLDYRTFALSKNGDTMIMQTGDTTPSRPVAVITTDLGLIRDVYGSHTADVEHTPTNIADTSASRASRFMTARESTGVFAEYYVAVNDNDLAFLRFSDAFSPPVRKYVGNGLDSTGAIQQLVMLTRNTSEATEQTFELIRSFDFYLVTTPQLTQSEITISRGIAYQTTDEGDAFDPDQTMVNYVIPATVWGGEISNVECRQVIADERYQSLYLFIAIGSDGNGAIIRWSALDEEVKWITECPAIPVGNVIAVSPESSKYYYWIDAQNDIYRLNKRTGTVLFIESLPDGMEIDGAQYYDAAQNAITFNDANGEVSRYYIGRIFSGRTPLRDILYDLLKRAGYADHQINVSEVTAYVDGYVIDTDVTLRSVLEQLGIIYDVTMRQRDNQIYATQNGDDSGAVVLDTGDIKETDYAKTVHVDGSEYSSVRVTYYDTDLYGGTNIQVVSSGTEGRGDEITVEYPFTGTAEFAASLAERILYDATINDEEMVIRVGPKNLFLSPGDYVIVSVRGLSPVTYFVKSTTVGADKATDLELVRRDTTATLLSPGVAAAVPGNVTNAPLADDFAVVSQRRPLALATNAIIPAHAQTGYSSTTSLYGGVIYTGDAEFEETQLYLRTATGATASVGAVTEPVKWGTVVTPPLPNSAVYATDRASQLVIEFAMTGVEAFFDAGSSLFDGYGRNTLYVNGELIQFRNWSVAPDGRTITFTNLMRGRHGTEQYVDTQEAGGLAVLYTPGSLILISTQLNDPVSDYLAVAVRTGLPASEEFAEQGVVVDHDFLKFYGPGNIHRSFLVTGDIVLTFNRRNRTPYGDELENTIPEEIPNLTYATYVLSAPYDEELFLNDVSDIPGSSYIRRVDTGSFTYTNAQQIDDGFDRSVDTLHVVVFQTPDAGDNIYPIARGHPAYRAITPSMKF